MNEGRTILVTGATGQQGGAAARRLLTHGWRVRALTRNGTSPAAQALARQGAELVVGDMADRQVLDLAMRDVHGVFSVQPTEGGAGTPSDYTVADELRLGIAVVEAAHDAGVKHLVYSSVAGAERNSGITRWQSKWQVEQRIAELQVPATILRAVRFMENHADPRIGIKDGVLTDVIGTTVMIQVIAVDDIGAFAQLAFDDPELYLGQAIEIAGDELTMPQIVEAIGAAIGRPITYRQLTRDVVENLGGDALAGYVFANERGGWQANVPALRSHHSELMSHDEWLTKVGVNLFANV